MNAAVRFSVYPDGTVSWTEDGVLYRCRRSGKKILAFLDEKGKFHPTKMGENAVHPELFTTLAVVIPEDEMQRFIEEFHDFKRQVRPDIDPHDWEIKGKGYKKSDGRDTTQEDMRRTWCLFSDWLRQLDIEWYLHAAVSNRPALTEARGDIDWGDKLVTHAFMRTNLAALLWNIVSLRGTSPVISGSTADLLAPRLMMHDLTVYYDRLSDKKLEEDLPKVFRFCFEQDAHLNGLVNTLNIGTEFNQLGFQDNNPHFSGIEFTDMILYVVYRFLAGEDVVGMTKDRFHAERYYYPLLHSIRHHISQRVFQRQLEWSSVVRVSREIDHTFGRAVYEKMASEIVSRIEI